MMHHVLPRDGSCEAPYQWYVCDLNGFRGCCSDTSVCDSKESTCPIESLPPDERPSQSTDIQFTGGLDFGTSESMLHGSSQNGDSTSVYKFCHLGSPFTQTDSETSEGRLHGASQNANSTSTDLFIL